MQLPLGFLELINNMLTSGMVPALFPDEEKEAIIGQVWMHSYPAGIAQLFLTGQRRGQ